MDQERAKQLISKFKSGELTHEEMALLESWYLQDWPMETVADLSEAELSAELGQMRASIPYLQPQTRRVNLWPRVAVAASLLIFLSFGSWLLLRKPGAAEQITSAQTRNIKPGGDKAVLTLANGKQIILNGAKNGQLAEQGNATISKTADGKVIYRSSDDKAQAQTVYNTMTTPRGGQYHLTLADGTGVWLNAASSITYPTTFNGAERRVSISGEAYFEVVHNAKMPFRVVAQNQLIEDIGTHFNINAYNDEPATKTTLLEGAVKVSLDAQNVLLNPGEQARWANGHFKVDRVDVDRETAWKNGNFQFDNADVKTVMRQLVRWYEVDIKYEGDIPDVHYTGLVPRRSSIAAVLNMLKKTGNTGFKVDGKTITVIK